MASPFTLKKTPHFLQLTPRVPREKRLFCPIDVSKHVHRTLFHDMDCQPLSDVLTFRAARQGLEVLLTRLQAIVPVQPSQLVLMGMEPTDVYDEHLRQNLHGRLYGSDQLHVA
jgi:transposase